MRSGMTGYGARLLATAALSLGVLGSAYAATQVKFGQPPWPGASVRTEVARELLEAIGYETSVTKGSWTLDIMGVAQGSLDADVALWLPTQKSTVEPLAKSGKIDLIAKIVPDAKYDLVVPDYVWKAGVHCICDLHKYADKFDHTIYGIEAGNDGNVLMKNAIKHNTYDLKGWHVQPSSAAAMLTQAGRDMRRKKWIVFLGWKPHWMNIKYNIRYLEDPKKIWGGKSVVWTAINPAFAAKHPNVKKFLSQMVAPAKIESQWIYDYGQKKQPLKQVAGTWIKNNLDLVSQWMQGVKTADGRQDAMAALKAKFSP
ncbi:ABC transporter substrate-binding protein [Salinisphaera hydrothermalis]|uniref:ABC transporter substrate-binding protein n=1 Tax=Salinisphaera hydrothermalis TaxID=563188 RepID=UPI003340024B